MWSGIKRSRASHSRATRRPALPGVLTAALSMSLMTVNMALAAGDQSNTTPQLAQLSNEELLKRLESLESEVKDLKGQLRQRAAPNAASPGTAGQAAQQNAQYQAPATPAPQQEQNKDLFGLYESPVEGLKLGAYGEAKLGAFQNPDANGQWQTGFDLSRIVLLPSYAVTDDIIFNAEIEFEHGGTAFDPDDKLRGTAEVEQAFIDFKVRDYLNFHSPGIDLVPIGFINLHHEPTEFYSVNRPELSNGLVPTTFRVPSWGTAYGQITNNLGYQFQISNSVEDFGDDFDTRTDSNRAPAGPFAPGIDGKDALANSRPPVGDFRQLSNSLALTGRLEYTLPPVPGLAGSTSVYYTHNTTPRGSHDESGNELGNSSLTLLDTELRYRVPKTGWELRGEFASAFIGSPENLRANNDGDPTNNVGDKLLGVSGEVAYHFDLGKITKASEWDLVPFARFTYEDFQTGGFKGTDANTPTGAGQKYFYTAGLALFPTPKIVLKLNYQHVEDNERAGAKSDAILGGVGFFLY